jgi:hypothetical protein
MDHELSNEELRAIELVAQLAALSPEGDATSVRVTLRMGNGRLVGEALLSEKAVEALTASALSLNAYLADDPDAPLDGLEIVDESHLPTPAPAEVLPVPAVAIDPILEADFAEHCIGHDLEFLIQMAAEDPNAAVAAFDEIANRTDGDA